MKLVEKVGKAILEESKHFGSAAYFVKDGDYTVERRLALAAFRAMREPTMLMVEAGDVEKEDCIDSDFDSDADGNRHDYTTINSDISARIFRAMIDAAIKEASEGGDSA
jgi:hypothetical protein